MTIRGIETPGAHWIRGLPTSLGFTANDPNQQLDFTRMASQDLDRIFGKDRYQHALSIDELKITDNQAATRVSLASPAMLLAFFIFLIEQVLANRFYRRG